MTTGEKVRDLMEKSGLSQKKFADSVGINPVSFCNYLKDDNFSEKMMRRIATALEIPYTDLLPDDAKPIAPNVVGYLEYKGKIEKIKDLRGLKKFVERVERDKGLMNVKQVKLPKQKPITLADIDLSRVEAYDASVVEVKSFRHGYDIVDDAAYPLGNMCSGYPFKLNGVQFNNSEAAYIAGMFSNDSPAHIKVQRLLQDNNDGYAAKKEIRKRNEVLARSKGDWNGFNVEWMKFVVWQKCKGNKDFADLLRKIPDETMIVENSTGMTGETADFWGCFNPDLEEIRDAKEELYKRKNPKAKKEDLNIERNKWHNFGVWRGTNEMGKILKMCSICLKQGIEMPIDYALLNSKHIYLLGKELRFEEESSAPVVEQASNHRCLLFDLDNTLINSDAKQDLMKQKPLDWQAIDGCIPKYRVYDGIVDVLKRAKDKGIKIGIVSTTRRDHIEKVLKHFNLTEYIDLIIGNQRAYKKPNPKLVEMALEGLGAKAENALYVGDHEEDAEMCDRAKVRFVGCIWDSMHTKELAAKGCETISKPEDILTLLG